MVIGDTKSNWWLFTRGMPHGLILGPILLNGFTNDLDNRREDVLSKISRVILLCIGRLPCWGGVPDTLEGKAAIKRNLDKLEKWA